MKEHLYYVYILSNHSRNTYIGVTGNLRRRVAQHKCGDAEGYTKRYRITRLVHFERYPYVKEAISREKEIKGWRREKKIRLIESENPTWADLAEGWDSVDMKFNPEAYRAAVKRTADAHRNAGPSPLKGIRDDRVEGFGMTDSGIADDKTGEMRKG